MRRDYAKLAVRRKRRGKSHTVLWLFTIVLFIAFTFGLVYLGKHRQSQSRFKTVIQETRVETQNKLREQEQSESAVKPQTQFEFTTPQALEQAKKDKKEKAAEKPVSKMTTEEVKPSVQQTLSTLQTQALQPVRKTKSGQPSAVAKAPTDTVQSSSVTPAAQQTVPGEKYFLEIIRAKNYTIADRIRAKLALMGYEATIATIKEQNKIYYRLTLGPFDKAEAAAKQQALTKNKMRTSLRKL